MPVDPYQEWRKLSDSYALMLDGELLRLAKQYADLTETAQQALRDEMRKRGLSEPILPKPEAQLLSGPDARFAGDFRRLPARETDGENSEDDGLPHEYTWKTELCECETREQAWQIIGVLGDAGVESWLQDPTRHFASPSLDLTGFRIFVAADQLEEARVILAQPIPQEIIDDSKIEVPEFDLPQCPRCGAKDPILCPAEELFLGDPKPETANWVNTWRCEACGKEWSDAAAMPEAIQ